MDEDANDGSRQGVLVEPDLISDLLETVHYALASQVGDSTGLLASIKRIGAVLAPYAASGS